MLNRRENGSVPLGTQAWCECEQEIVAMYEFFEHTADVGLRVRAVDVVELFSDAARGLFSVMAANLSSVQPVEEIAIHLESDTLEDLWHNWLSELLYVFHGRRLVLTEFHIEVRLPEGYDAITAAGEPPAKCASPAVLDAVARGEPIDPLRHEIELEVKAVTWHRLKVERQPSGWLAEVILDI
jgi:SHS2 domain-containing protein